MSVSCIFIDFAVVQGRGQYVYELDYRERHTLKLLQVQWFAFTATFYVCSCTEGLYWTEHLVNYSKPKATSLQNASIKIMLHVQRQGIQQSGSKIKDDEVMVHFIKSRPIGS